MIFSASNIKIVFDENPQFIKHIFLSDGSTVCAHGKQTILVRTPIAVSEPILLSSVQQSEFEENKGQIIFQDQTGNWQAELQIESTDNGIRFIITVTAPEPIWLIEWRLTSLKVDEIIVPALGGQVLTIDMPDETTLSYKYPFWWNAQFAIGKIASGGLWLCSRDEKPNLKLLRVSKYQDGFSLTYGYEAPAPLISRKLESEWYFDGFTGDWQMPVDCHRQWLEKAFDLKKLADKPNFPDWAEDINFMLEIWGARRDSEIPMHTFEQMIDRLKAWQKLHPPQETLVYLPGFAENGIDSHAPDYNPSIQCGGPEKFKQLIDTAHGLGYKVMIHTNVLAMTFGHPLFPEFKRHQVVDCFERSQGWGLDMDGDWLAEPYFVYINPGAKQWGDLMERVIGDLIRKFQIDAVFLDQTLLAFNVSAGPNFIEGMRSHIQRLQQAFPQILFAGEGMHEHVVNPLPMAQIHGIDSIAEVHGMEGHRPWRQVHPVSTYLFGKYVKFVAHLLTKHPSHPMFKFQEAAYERLGVIPALCLYNNQQPMDLPAVHKMIERSKKL
jgi:hypothetical protein